MSDEARRALRELLDAGFASLLDPNPIRLRPADDKGVGAVRRACERDTGNFVGLASPLNRNEFLCGCLDYLEREPVEHLIAGLGQRYGSTTRVDAIAHVVGEQGRVAVPAWIWESVRDRTERSPGGEALLVHNHPHPSLDALFDTVPVASGTDRDVILGTWKDPRFWLGLVAGRRVRAYVVASGYVREFRTPKLLELLERAFKRRRAGKRSLHGRHGRAGLSQALRDRVVAPRVWVAD